MSPIPQPAPPHARAADPSPEHARILARSPGACFRHGALHSLPFLLVLVPFGALFGVVGVEAGLDLAQIMGFSVLVLAGASQFTAVQLMVDHAPMIVVVISALAVNLRLAMYSASLVPWIGAAGPGQRAVIAYLLVDQSYGLAIQEYERHPRLRVDQRLGYFFGASCVMCSVWMVSTIAGATLGRAIPESWPLDFAVPITFLAMIAPMLRTLAHMAAALVSILLALAFAFLPSGLGLLIAAPAAMATGALVETMMLRCGERAR